MGRVVNAIFRPLYPRERPGTHFMGGTVGTGPIWTGAENPTHTGIRTADRPARSESLYRLSYSGPQYPTVYTYKPECLFINMFNSKLETQKKSAMAQPSQRPATISVCQTRGCNYSFWAPDDVLMTGGVSPETCWAIKKHWNNKFYYTVAYCWFFLWDLICIYVFGSEWAPVDINKTGSLTIYLVPDHPY
jgi:hypothetical protein